MSGRADDGARGAGSSRERHEPHARQEPTKHEQEHNHAHAGNATVNHGPDEKGPEGLIPDISGSGSDEPDLRRLLHSAVDDLQPRAGTLEHLRRAVPARRARKRQAVVGMAAAALFIGTAIPALVHVSNASGSDPNTAMAGQSSQAQGGTGQGKDKNGTPGGKHGGDSTSVKPGKETGKPEDKGEHGSASGGASAGADPSATLSTNAPVCTAAQLGSATATADAPDSAGIVYGTFRVTNISGAACTVGGAGSVSPTAQGAADQSKVGAARHAAGDAATSLPDPSQEVAALVLKPGAAYEERFAFVPSETCPTTGGGSTGSDTGGPSPDPTPTGETGSAGGTTDTGSTSSGPSAQLVAEDGGTADGSILITHTAQAGSPSASAVVPHACAGTVYYTGVLAGA
ncbi:hypothetical protein GCM10010503_44510 [Streptomyces lucensis JCM 4490]|uniref:DUF4232 domain-containing protein n=1 Tax=Streptomyces lucensis JCM 4490 TaxID=1306176 RepID=A0A918JCH9_9ACTN|nr:hypothetical protein [Streptomyces lucensis]GGW62338.1 hypothetical protein GCM10010503_44510 [Streptomyces lucensis JCM 4490]